MQRLVSQFNDSTLYSRGDAFTTLVRAIIGQQISVKAAASVWQKLATALSKLHLKICIASMQIYYEHAVYLPEK